MWIKVSDRLPPIETKVWVYDNHGVRATTFGKQVNKDFKAHLKLIGCTHWQEFKEPEKPENELF